MFEAVEKFLRCGVSSLPVIEEILTGNNANCSASCQPPKNRLIDALTKVDLMHFVVEKGWTDLQEKTVADVLKQRHEVEYVEKVAQLQFIIKLAMPQCKVSQSAGFRYSSVVGRLTIGSRVRLPAVENFFLFLLVSQFHL